MTPSGLYLARSPNWKTPELPADSARMRACMWGAGPWVCGAAQGGVGVRDRDNEKRLSQHIVAILAPRACRQSDTPRFPECPQPTQLSPHIPEPPLGYPTLDIAPQVPSREQAVLESIGLSSHARQLVFIGASLYDFHVSHSATWVSQLHFRTSAARAVHSCDQLLNVRAEI